jgi:hypothetical protein
VARAPLPAASDYKADFPAALDHVIELSLLTLNATK